MSTLILLRHGQSAWNAQNRFTGWVDVDLTERGETEARAAGRVMAAHGIAPDIIHTSLLTRAVRSANITLDAMGRSWLPVRRSWRLNERHYGALQGRDKEQTADRFGAEQVNQWRRSFHTAPPLLTADTGPDARYSELPADLIPTGESLADVHNRVLPWWYDAIIPDLAAGRVVLVVAHGNSLRALVKHLKAIPDNDIAALSIATGQPWQFELDGRHAVTDDFRLDPLPAKQHAEVPARTE
ncbi:MAG: 2,3-bisphosphoglycerate-dependent phosphoglycerate mutase [Acidimicrobiales bacterium]